MPAMSFLYIKQSSAISKFMLLSQCPELKNMPPLTAKETGARELSGFNHYNRGDNREINLKYPRIS